MELEKRNAPKFTQEIPFILMHLMPLGALAYLHEITWIDWVICLGLYYFRMFWITAGYHRYFAHRAYSTSRWFQFIIAFFAQTSVQKGALWWAAHHRVHHRTSDTPQDPHSMKLYGFWYSHIGWILGPDYKETEFHLIQDYAKFSELKWLNRFHTIPGILMGIGVFVAGGFIKATEAGFNTPGAFATLFIGFFLSTVFLYHGTFSINSIMHKFGKQRYKTGDESKNNFFLALLTMGEGWHNNHHYYMVAARQGFYWWEIDMSFYILKMMSWVGLVWDLKGVPDHVREARSLEEVRAKQKTEL